MEIHTLQVSYHHSSPTKSAFSAFATDSVEYAYQHTEQHGCAITIRRGNIAARPSARLPTAMAHPGGFDFWAEAKARKCYSRNAKYMLMKGAEKKYDGQYGNSESENNILITKEVLQEVLSKGKLVTLMRCPCPVCGPVSSKTPPAHDENLASNIARSPERQALFATLAFMGGTFAARLLDRHVFHTVEQTLDRMHDRADLRRNLFAPFWHTWNESLCQHKERHERCRSRADDLLCLEEDFREQLRAAAWIFKVPHFQANNLLRHFGERQNMPFINQTRLPIGNLESGREFYKFEIHPAYCDEKLQGRLLFRKQLSIDSNEARKRVHEESGILEFLKELANPNIAEVLFAFQEEHPHSFSLVFEFHPIDLQKVLYPQNARKPDFREPEKTVESFPGSVLDHWLWIGLLGVFDAVAAVHEPLNQIKSIPQSSTSKFVGGHFDIKPGNIVIDANGRFLLTDFGQAFFKEVKVNQETNFTITAGTFNYRPPPSYSKRKADNTDDLVKKKWWSREYDVWSLACVSVEVLAFIVDGADAPRAFYQERENEDPHGYANFWTTESGRDVLKYSVRQRLSRYRRNGDDYLTRVAEQMEKMFQIEKTEPATAKACHRELSASVKVDRFLFKGRDDEMIAGEGTFACLKTMRTSFSTDRVSSLRCSLYLWRNVSRGRITLTLEFAGSDNQTIVTPSSAKTSSDEFVPLALFDPDSLFDQNRFRSNGPFLQCAFQNMHDGVTFHFAKRWDFYHFFGAFTHQHVQPGSEFRFKSCKVEAAGMRSKSWSSDDGHLQIWRELRPDDYDRLYKQRAIPTITHPQSPRLEDNSSSSSSSIKKRYSRLTLPCVVYFRLAIYLCGPTSRALAVVSLNHDAFHITFDENQRGRPRMIFERRSRSDIWATVFESSVSSDSAPLNDSCPGIPMSEQALASLLENGKGLKRLELEFWNEEDQRKFAKHYNEMWDDRFQYDYRELNPSRRYSGRG
ncbi:hypothetical protein K469DRAFT_167381 [Zopfia rhizophila CBS 207.26]|uniref:Protein kinase domain-containing protein n=1 Tax=Zopfia rhizophila CBS 207.26 TaxID=1314779 RepID=A0A6A6E1R8_9PEZI|nr:hypothetical protein K469DRAFT_167381 [Zopfia rhizophila CBS 207.26]